MKHFVWGLLALTFVGTIALYAHPLTLSELVNKVFGAGSYYTQEITLLDNVTATSTGWIRTKSYRNVVFALDTADSASGTIKFVGSVNNDAPDVNATASSSNQFDYIQVVDLEDGTSIDGDTGIVLTGTDDHRLFEVNTNLLGWVGAYVSTYTTGTINVIAIAGDNT